MDELAHLAASLADQGNHVDVRLGAAGDHAQQRTLPDAGAGKDAHALPAPHREEGVDGADAGMHRGVDELPLHGRGRVGVHGLLAVDHERALAIDGVAAGVDDAAQQPGAYLHGKRQVGPLYEAARAQARRFVERH